MKRLLFLALFLATSMFAMSIQELYIAQGGEITPKLQQLLKDDQHYIKAEQYLTNKNFMKESVIKVGDPENLKQKPVEKKQLIPDYENALKEFEKSVQKYQNQVSAFYGIYLIKSFFGKSSKLEDFKNFSQLLYEKEKQICEVYIDYGETLENGYFSKVDTTKALEVYKSGFAIRQCKESWFNSVLSGRINKLEKKMKK
jgi:hypothetical protein